MIGLLLDSVSPNTGDQAIAEVMVSWLCRNGLPAELLSPLQFDAERYAPLIIGGGHLLREKGDWFYDPFRVPGRHILNTVGITTSDDLSYLGEYLYVSVRSCRDLARIAQVVPRAVVCPCVSLLLEPDDSVDLAPRGCIGFHFHNRAWECCGDDSVFLDFKEYQQALLPITYYNGDYILLGELSRKVAVRQTLIPRLSPRAVLSQIGRMRAFVTSSLHGAIFAYSRNVPFLAFGESDKMMGFMEDRGLLQWVFRDSAELRNKLTALLGKPPDYSSLLSEDAGRLAEHMRRMHDCIPKAHLCSGTSVVGKPRVEHRVLIEHDHKLAVIEREEERLRLATERIGDEVSRLSNRVARLFERMEGGDGGCVLGATGSSLQSPKCLPFGVMERPSAGSVVSESCDVSGWALAEGGVVAIEGYIDGQLAIAGVYGDHRPDVARVYPGFPDSEFCGWRVSVEVDQVSIGRHELVIQARSFAGATRDLGALLVERNSEEEALHT